MSSESVTYRWLTRDTLLHEVKENPRLIRQLAQFSRLLVELAPASPEFASVEPCARQLMSPAKIIEQLRSGTHLLLATTPHDVVGVDQIDLRKGKLYNRFIAVHPDYQRKKIGKKLILHLIGIARKNNFTELHSGLDTIASNRFFRKLGTEFSHRNDLRFEFEPMPEISPTYTRSVIHFARRKANKAIPRKR